MDFVDGDFFLFADGGTIDSLTQKNRGLALIMLLGIGVCVCVCVCTRTCVSFVTSR